MASAKEPRAAAAADSQPLSISISEAIEPKMCTPRESRIRADAPSRFCEVNFIASNLDSTAFRSRSAARSESTKPFNLDFEASSADLAVSKAESRPSSPESALAISSSKDAYSRDALSTRCWASSRALVRRAISSAIASRRAWSDLMWPSWRAVPSRASAIARIAAAILSSSILSACSAVASAVVAAASAVRESLMLFRKSFSSLRKTCASFSNASGSRPAERASSASSLRKRERSWARLCVPRNFSRKEFNW